MSQTPPPSPKQIKAARLQAALRDNLRRRKQAETPVTPPEDDSSRQPQN